MYFYVGSRLQGCNLRIQVLLCLHIMMPPSMFVGWGLLKFLCMPLCWIWYSFVWIFPSACRLDVCLLCVRVSALICCSHCRPVVSPGWERH